MAVSFKQVKPIFKEGVFVYGKWYTDKCVAVHVDEFPGGTFPTGEAFHAIFGAKSVLHPPSQTHTISEMLDDIVDTWHRTAVWTRTAWVYKKDMKDPGARAFVLDPKKKDQPESAKACGGLFLAEDHVQAFNITEVYGPSATEPVLLPNMKVCIQPWVIDHLGEDFFTAVKFRWW